MSDVFAHAAPRPIAERQAVLYLAFHIDDLTMAPSRHLLAEVEVVSFGRGERSVARCEVDGKRALVLRIPDPVMSSEHGRLVRLNGSWRLEAPTSRNGAVVNGHPTRMAMLAPGAVIQLGHTILLLEQATFATDTNPDVIAAPLTPPLSDLVSLDPAFATAIADLERLAATDVSILLLGETGTGKEVVARALHELSQRKGELVAVNCGAIPSTLVESELFGHKKGTFSGAQADRPGHLRAAHRGTLFLDEIAELPPAAQTALLRALQQREVVPVGESLPMPIDLRVIAATHRDMVAMVDEGRFREDLYSRLLGVTIRLPPLRERKFDLGILIGTLLRRLDSSGRARITPRAAYLLFAYSWPRNVRELERTLLGALARCANGWIDIDLLPGEISSHGSDPEAASATEMSSSALTSEEQTLLQKVIDVLTRHRGNITTAAKELGKEREQIYRWARRFGIDLESFRR
jgi:transcriptional regulator with PAS, ATPase and Fis domain